MKTKITSLITAGILGTTLASQAAVMIITPSADGQVRDTGTTQDGIGDSANAGTPFAGFHTNTRNGNIKPVWAFSLATAGSPSSVQDAEISIEITTIPVGTNFNLDLYAVRIVSAATFATDNGGDGFLASDYENSDGAAILEDFWKPTDGLGIRTADMTTYLQGSSWSSTDFLIVGLKSDPLTLTGSSLAWVGFAGTTQLAVTAVPEPSTAALLGLGGFALIFRRRK